MHPGLIPHVQGGLVHSEPASFIALPPTAVECNCLSPVTRPTLEYINDDPTLLSVSARSFDTHCVREQTTISLFANETQRPRGKEMGCLR
ncbi:hypothetical protein HPP92_005375 [Vanilla planifolia]|uniref:Uncharacterized protein n=1 Tax=Vanilla planifolia TaxID=51239 RepID=A0A835VAX8_VANPL|nr:hypothetical protein HPP92_005375 [Vanilla planifolia]